MSVRSELDLAEALSTDIMDDAHELQEHEFVLDLEEAELLENKNNKKHKSKHTQTSTQGVRAVPPPPPPPRRDQFRQLASWQAARMDAPLQLQDPLGRSRSPSGVFPIADVHEALSAHGLAPAGVTAADAEISRLRAQLRARDAYVVEIERALDAWTVRLSAAGIESAGDLAQLLGRARGHAYRAAELQAQQAELAKENAELRSALARDEQQDSPLRRVRGIGRRYARQLESLGVVSVEQIASWSDDEVARYASELRITASRIAREAWIEQARALCASEGL